MLVACVLHGEFGSLLLEFEERARLCGCHVGKGLCSIVFLVWCLARLGMVQRVVLHCDRRVGLRLAPRLGIMPDASDDDDLADAFQVNKLENRWFASLQFAFRDHCKLGKDPREFVKAAEKLAAVGQEVCVFESDERFHGHKKFNNDEADEFIRECRSSNMSLGRAVTRAHRVAKGPSLSYGMVGSVLKRVVLEPSRSFCARFTTNAPTIDIMKMLRVENCTRMLDYNTWQFIDFGRAFIRQCLPELGGRTMSQLDWKKAIAWTLRVEYACFPEKFCRDVAYDDPTHYQEKRKWKHGAYNHQCGNKKVCA